MSSLRPLQLVDGPASPGPQSAPYSSFVSPPPSASTSRPDRRFSLQIQPSPRTPITPLSPTPPQLKRHSSQSQTAEHRVLTLAERHADLLRFIAQKESKCLELRQQLAQHEADLLALKRKWERIVSRGSAGASTSSMPTPPSSNRDSMDFLSLSGGLKDGVGRMLSGLALGDMFPAQAQPSDATGSTSATQGTKADAQRSSLSGSSVSTTLSEAEHEDEEEDRDNRDSIVTTPSEEALIDLASPTDDAIPPPPPAPSAPVEHRHATTPRPSRMTVAIGHSNSPSLASPTPLPLHSSALANIVPMVNRKWEELKGTETMQRSQKRASTLLNDVFAALVPPPTPSPAPTTTGTLAERRRASGNANGGGGVSPLPSPALSNSSRNSQKTTIPSPAQKISSTTSPAPATRDNYMDDDDEWNW
ncbi:hypothetical protein EXIGLDRAFT_753671 [Exidia glandulosa HHB12029]|uniref:DUF4048 domain-containing protein n=1 Tax=Exidia glandulosa HHB12029 TaxID=1314781 RepID=A0A165DJP4_EXIGL|nr:hypothetical protein EXIGLDRAFT_753671 [Exidia glandulosa HHB12029]